LAFLLSFTPQAFGRFWEADFIVRVDVSRAGKNTDDV